MRIRSACLWHCCHSLYGVRLKHDDALRGVGVRRDEEGEGLEDSLHGWDVVVCHGHPACVLACRASARGNADAECAEHVSFARGDARDDAGGVREVAECAVEGVGGSGGGGRGRDEAKCDEGAHRRPRDEHDEDGCVGRLHDRESVEGGDDIGEVLGLVG